MGKKNNSTYGYLAGHILNQIGGIQLELTFADSTHQQ
jgi:hypothetical protein